MKRLISMALAFGAFSTMAADCKINQKQFTDLLSYEALTSHSEIFEQSELQERFNTLATPDYGKKSEGVDQFIEDIISSYNRGKDRAQGYKALKEDIIKGLKETCSNSDMIELVSKDQKIKVALSKVFQKDLNILKEHATPLLRFASNKLSHLKETESDDGKYIKIKNDHFKVEKENGDKKFNKIQESITYATSKFIETMPEYINAQLTLSTDTLINTGITLHYKSSIKWGISLSHLSGLTRDLGDLNHLKECLNNKVLPIEEGEKVGTLIYRINTKCDLDTENYYVNAITNGEYSKDIREFKGIFKDAVEHLDYKNVPSSVVSLRLQFFNKEEIAKTFGEENPFVRTRALKNELNKALQERTISFHKALKENPDADTIKYDEKAANRVQKSYQDLEDAITQMRKSVERVDKIDIYLPTNEEEKLLFNRSGLFISNRATSDIGKRVYAKYSDPKQTYNFTVSPYMMNYYSFGFEKCDISFGDYMSSDLKYYNIGCEDSEGTSFYRE